MASVKIRFKEADNLPHVCVYCGEPACQKMSKTFTYRPSWVTLVFFASLLVWPLQIVWLILIFTTPRRATLMMPVCPSHVNGGQWSKKLLIAGLVTFFVGVFAAMSLRTTNIFLSNCVLLSGIGVLVVAGLVVLMTAETTISANEIGDRSITLNGICEKFEDALDDEPVQLVAVGGKAKPSNGGIELMTAKYMKR